MKIIKRQDIILQVMELLDCLIETQDSFSPNRSETLSIKEYNALMKKLSDRASHLLKKAGNVDPDQIILFQLGKEVLLMTSKEMAEIILQARNLLNFLCEMQECEYESINLLSEWLMDKELHILNAALEMHSIPKTLKPKTRKSASKATKPTGLETFTKIRTEITFNQTIFTQSGKELSKMTLTEKQELIRQIADLIEFKFEATESESKLATSSDTEPIELLTVKQCAERVRGLSERAIRSLAKSGEIPYITVGKSKMLIGKDDLMTYVKKHLK